jgi:hypothetical protein
MEIDRDVEAAPAQLLRQLEIVDDPPKSARAWRHDDLVEVRIVTNDGRGIRLDKIDEARRWIFTPQGAHERRREHNVADESQAQ